jgi:hypothetical protein
MLGTTGWDRGLRRGTEEGGGGKRGVWWWWWWCVCVCLGSAALTRVLCVWLGMSTSARVGGGTIGLPSQPLPPIFPPPHQTHPGWC